MTHIGSATIPKALQKRIDKLPGLVEKNGLRLLPEFGMFIDTHRDQPHVGSFADDIHRGACLPTLVDYVVNDDLLRNPNTGKLLVRHEKHQFITAEAWGEFLLKALIENGADPRAGDGTLPTSHFRDARKGIYVLRSFRQMVEYHARKP